MNREVEVEFHGPCFDETQERTTKLSPMLSAEGSGKADTFGERLNREVWLRLRATADALIDEVQGSTERKGSRSMRSPSRHVP